MYISSSRFIYNFITQIAWMSSRFLSFSSLRHEFIFNAINRPTVILRHLILTKAHGLSFALDVKFLRLLMKRFGFINRSIYEPTFTCCSEWNNRIPSHIIGTWGVISRQSLSSRLHAGFKWKSTCSGLMGGELLFELAVIRTILAI